MDHGSDLGATDGASATRAKQDLVFWNYRISSSGTWIGERVELIPKMPSFQTSLTYSCLARGMSNDNDNVYETVLVSAML